MFPIHINDGQTELPKDDVFYIIAKDGIYLRKNLGIMDSLVPVKNISILEEITTTARMNIKKIPAWQFATIISFFKEVYKQYRSECIVLLFYNEETKLYKVVPPSQKVSPGALNYDRGLSLEGWTMVGDIHSHANMSAFHSGTDHDDELSFDGLHITLGNMGDDNISISASIVSNGHRVIIDPNQYINRLTKTKDVDEQISKPTCTIWKYCSETKKMIPDEISSSRFGSKTYRRLDKRYALNVSKKYFKVPDGWMDMVEHQRWQGYGGNINANYRRNQNIIDSWGGSLHNRKDWGYNFNSHLWKNLPQRKPKQLELFKTPEEEKSITNTDDDIPPCLTCKFKSFKLLLEENDLEEDQYKCAQCECVWDESVLIKGELCPICGIGDFLTLCEDYEEENTELQNEYIPDDKYNHLFLKDDSTPIEVKSDYIRCSQCGETFHLYSDESKCPFCYALNDPKPSVQQKDKEHHMRSDSGEFLGKDTEKINTAAKKEINSSVEKIPVPSEKQVPLPEKSTTDPFPLVRAMLERVFNKRG